MPMIDCDVAIVGSGFGGTLLALIARKLGLDVVLLERGRHPRFTIGESSTPLADFKLAAIADRFGLDWLKPFAKYGTWKKHYPGIRRGCKRGFSFFHHQRGQLYAPMEAGGNALMVAASPDEERADTHWFRADFDAFLVDHARAAGVVFVDDVALTSCRHERGWRLVGVRQGEAINVRAGLLVDAAGAGRLSGEALGLEEVEAAELLVQTRALYGHFEGVRRWQDVLDETHGPAATARYPFPCDAAALHHIIERGWMWVLAFDHGIVSAGFSLDPRAHPICGDETPEQEWQRLVKSYPSLNRQFGSARPVAPLVRTGRLQRRVKQAAGPDWALLPHAAGFQDAWLSPGIAQTLFAVERLGRILAVKDDRSNREEKLAAYGRGVLEELAWIDEITAACFACFDRFEVMTTVSMLYFAAAHYCEERERAGKAPADAAFLLADDEAYRRIAQSVCRAAREVRNEDASAFSAHVRELLAPYNLCGLLDPSKGNMYPFASSLSCY